MRLSTTAWGSHVTTGRVSTGLSAIALAVGVLTSGVASAAPSAGRSSMHVQLHKLRMCESGDQYHLDTGNGYYGAYQFARSTWHALGYHGRPDHARRVTQNRAAKKLHATVGWTAWPSCAVSEHLH